MNDDDSTSLDAQEQAAFVQSVERVRIAVGRELRAHPDATSTVAFVRTLQRGVDRLLDHAMRDGRRIDCEAGCSHCCHARVEATAPEIFAIVDALDRRSGPERSAVAARLATSIEAAATPASPWPSRAACPFLVDRRCAIYPVRPTACRKAHSTDVGRCAAHAATIPQDLQVALGAEALMRGTALAYEDAGFDATRHELVGAVAAVMADPSLRERWAAGARPDLRTTRESPEHRSLNRRRPSAPQRGSR